KSGVAPEETEAFAHRVVSGEYPHLRLRGFMTMAPKSTEEEYRIIFGNTRRLCEGIWSGLPMSGEPMVLSMGMSESYVPAAAEGATLVRVGRGLFVKDEG
ncbi:MAG: alanine racemase, partial [Clostridia bacterium]|nr:alanine racemase [Clostridia bacterium]